MKMQESVIFAKKNFEIIRKIKKYRKVRNHCHYTRGYRSTADSIVAFHNGSNYDYHIIVKELAEKLIKKNTCLGQNTEIYITFTVPREKILELIKMEKNLYKKYLTYYSLFIV